MNKFLMIGLAVLVVAILGTLWMATLPMFEVEEEKLAAHSIPGGDYKIEIVRVQAGAMMQWPQGSREQSGE